MTFTSGIILLGEDISSDKFVSRALCSSARCSSA